MRPFSDLDAHFTISPPGPAFTQKLCVFANIHALQSFAWRKRKGGTGNRAALASNLVLDGQSAIGRTLPSLMRFSMTCWAMFFGTASYCLKIIVNEPRPCVTVRIAFE